MSRKRYPSDKLWYERSRKKLYEHEIQNGVELLGKEIRVSDFVKKKVLEGRTKLLIINDKLVLFHKGSTGHWCNNSTFNHEILLHREVFKQHTGMTDEDLKGMEIHHIDDNKDNNDISNLKLLSKKEHAKLHLVDNRKKLEKVCKFCGKKYNAINPRSSFCNPNCYNKWRRRQKKI